MARSALSDYLQVYSFWLCDVAPIEPLALPLFTPLLGFQQISAPEMTVEFQEITEANWHFKKKVVKAADVSNITLMRGATWYDMDFYKWIFAALDGSTEGRGDPITRKGKGGLGLAVGGPTPRRDLLLIQYLPHSPIPASAAYAASAAGMLALQGTVTGLTGGASSLTSFSYVGTAGASVAGLASVGRGLGPIEIAPRIPAKAWILYGCVPARYKAAGDFDATSSEISLQELEIVVEHWDEIGLSF